MSARVGSQKLLNEIFNILPPTTIIRRSFHYLSKCRYTFFPDSKRGPGDGQTVKGQKNEYKVDTRYSIRKLQIDTVTVMVIGEIHAESDSQ